MPAVPAGSRRQAAILDPRALALLQESATKTPENPEAQYHLGMVYQKLGNKEAAKQALGRALTLNQQFSGADEARRVLGELR